MDANGGTEDLYYPGILIDEGDVNFTDKRTKIIMLYFSILLHCIVQ
jgi:hypothetical protein